MSETELNKMKEELKTLQRKSRPIVLPFGIFCACFGLAFLFIGLPLWAVIGGGVLQMVLAVMAWPHVMAISRLGKKIAAMEAGET
jgi:hypothetical protein